MALARRGSTPLYGVDGQLIGSVGATGQIRQGHILTAKSFPAALAADNTKLAYFNLNGQSPDTASLAGDEMGVHNLTANGGAVWTALNIFNAAGAYVADGAADSLSSVAANAPSFFNPGNGVSWSLGGWFRANSWTTSTQVFLHLANAAGSDGALQCFIDNTGLTFRISSTGTIGAGSDINFNYAAAAAFSPGSWHHIAVAYNYATTTATIFVDGDAVFSGPLVNTRAVPLGLLAIGAQTAGNFFFAGAIEDFFFVNNYALTDADIAILASTRLDHNSGLAAAKQRWEMTHFAQGIRPASGLGDSLVLDKNDTNSAFVDFSNLDPTDQVSIRLTEIGA